MPADYLDTREALRQLNLYFDAEAIRGSVLHGDRASRWEAECVDAFRRLWQLLRSVLDTLPGEQTRALHDRALGLLADSWDVPPLVIQRGLRPETAAHLLSILTQLQAALFRLRIELRKVDESELARQLQESMDEITLPIARLAAHVHALSAIYDLLMVRPAYRVIQHWLFGEALPVEADEEEAEIE